MIKKIFLIPSKAARPEGDAKRCVSKDSPKLHEMKRRGTAFSFKLILIPTLLFTSFTNTNLANQETLTNAVVQIENKTKSSLEIFLGVLSDGKIENKKRIFLNNLKKCLEFSDAFSVDIKRIKKIPKKKSIKKLFKRGYDCAIFVDLDLSDGTVKWWLEKKQAGEKKYNETLSPKEIAHETASDIIYALTGDQSPFRTKIAFRKNNKKKKKSLIIVSDFDGNNTKTIVSSKKIVVAPSWIGNSKKICFSENNPSEVRFMGADLLGRKWKLFDNLDGTNVGLSYNDTVDFAVYCRSGNLWKYEYDDKKNIGRHRLLIREHKSSACPKLLDSGDVVYCSGGKIKYYGAQKKRSRFLTTEGYSVAPDYTNQKIVFSKRVGKNMELFIYDMTTQQEKQLTFGKKTDPKGPDYKSDKTDPSFSPCGNYVAFCWKRDNDRSFKSRIAVLNVKTKKYKFITKENELCSYPSWSSFL